MAHNAYEVDSICVSHTPFKSTIRSTEGRDYQMYVLVHFADGR